MNARAAGEPARPAGSIRPCAGWPVRVVRCGCPFVAQRRPRPSGTMLAPASAGTSGMTPRVARSAPDQGSQPGVGERRVDVSSHRGSGWCGDQGNVGEIGDRHSSSAGEWRRRRQDRHQLLLDERLGDEPFVGNRPSGRTLAELAPVTTGLGEVLMYVLEPKEGSALAAKPERDRLLHLREVQDYTIRPQLKKLPGIVDVDTNGGLLKQVHINVFPDAWSGTAFRLKSSSPRSNPSANLWRRLHPEG